MIIQPVSEVVKFCDAVGDPYDTQLTLQWLTPCSVHVCNLSGTFTRKMRHELKASLIARGVTEVTWARCKAGRWTRHKRTAENP